MFSCCSIIVRYPAGFQLTGFVVCMYVACRLFGILANFWDLVWFPVHTPGTRTHQTIKRPPPPPPTRTPPPLLRAPLSLSPPSHTTYGPTLVAYFARSCKRRPAPSTGCDQDVATVNTTRHVKTRIDPKTLQTKSLPCTPFQQCRTPKKVKSRNLRLWNSSMKQK